MKKQMLYVCGLLFMSNTNELLVIQKNVPENYAGSTRIVGQHGKYNGLGGLVQDNETPYAAIVRKAMSEASIKTEEKDWSIFAAVMEETEDTVYQIIYLSAFVDSDVFYTYKTMTDEPVSQMRVSDVTHNDMADSLQWLIPMARDRKFYATVEMLNRELPYTLTQADIDSDPSWKEAGLDVGSEIKYNHTDRAHRMMAQMMYGGGESSAFAGQNAEGVEGNLSTTSENNVEGGLSQTENSSAAGNASTISENNVGGGLSQTESLGGVEGNHPAPLQPTMETQVAVGGEPADTTLDSTLQENIDNPGTVSTDDVPEANSKATGKPAKPAKKA